jgi:hypothetical protein
MGLESQLAHGCRGIKCTRSALLGGRLIVLAKYWELKCLLILHKVGKVNEYENFKNKRF